ncbi:MAG: hypothetical protein ACRDGG_12410 [Anaerolineae bacterium]
MDIPFIRQLLKLVPEYRGRRIGEETAVYEAYTVEHLLATVPLPAL